MKRIAILGSTGSIGTQALEVIREQKNHFEVEVLTANNNVALLAKQSREFVPNVVVIGNEQKYEELVDALSDLPIKVYAGNSALVDVVSMDSIDMVLTAMVGYAGLEPTIAAIRAKKAIALANKETLVVAGDLITRLALENKTSIIPVDSEHSAIFQCLAGEFSNPIEKIILTASGGPFVSKNVDYLKTVRKTEALKHPNWDMGAKITIDSATMMNKGLEAIEAKWLFDLRPEQIDIIVHQQSIIHSLVQFDDGSMKAQMGLPDMKLPIQYALTYPERLFTNFTRFNFLEYPELTFQKPDFDKFRSLGLAFEAMRRGGNVPCVLNAANEIAVSSFLQEKIGFLEIPEIIEKTMARVCFIDNPDIDNYRECDAEAREIAHEEISVSN